MKPLSGDYRHKLLISGDELEELKKHTYSMAEAFGLDRKIENYMGTRPITLYRWDLECLMNVIDLALKDERDYPDKSAQEFQTLNRLGDGFGGPSDLFLWANQCLQPCFASVPLSTMPRPTKCPGSRLPRTRNPSPSNRPASHERAGGPRRETKDGDWLGPRSPSRHSPRLLLGRFSPFFAPRRK
jgi:hypothetical protein